MPAPSTHSRNLPAAAWQAARAGHLARVRGWAGPARERRARGEKHPVHDFLTTYYSYPLSRLERWHPGVNVCLEDHAEAAALFGEAPYRRSGGWVFADPGLLSERRRRGLQWIRDLLAATQKRPPQFACHGLHEWAMVFRGGDIRHRESAPLRLPQEEIDAVVSRRPIRCSHFDAFRFFAPAARPYNRMQPGAEDREQHEQPGCIHANMDLYKWCYKAMPWAGSELLWDCFRFALAAREVDMRASPYDLSSYGYEPITVETEDGRRQYENEQRRLCEDGRPLRDRLIAVLENVLADGQGDPHTADDATTPA